MVVGVRSSAADVSVLVALATTRRQVAVMVATMASTIVVASAAIGVPLGSALGRALWQLMAESVDASTPPVNPLGAIVLLAIGTLITANVVAMVPARLAAHRHPSVALRRE